MLNTTGQSWAEQHVECGHDRLQLRRKRQVNGVWLVGDQCLRCGRRIGNSRPHATISDIDSLPEWDLELQAEHRRLLRTTEPPPDSLRPNYREYLQSPRWAALRTLILERDHYQCQACFEATASDVHHLTYAHLGHEFCWELVSVCRGCHIRIHGVPN